MLFIVPSNVSLEKLKIETLNTQQNAVCGVLTLRYTPVCAVSTNQRRVK